MFIFLSKSIYKLEKETADKFNQKYLIKMFKQL